MSRKRFDEFNCGVAQALEQVGDWWTLLIVRDAFFGSTRFAEFEQGLGIAKNILSDRLQKLVQHEILSKEPLEGAGSRHEYKLTRKGRDLWLVLTALRLWSDKWVFGKGNEPIVAREGDTGRVLSALLAVDDQGQPLDPGSLRWAAGPGAGEPPGE
jgi:DNA-binding HxlR family transcriptional regulator